MVCTWLLVIDVSYSEWNSSWIYSKHTSLFPSNSIIGFNTRTLSVANCRR
jgi:hypothetical protein